MNKLKAIIFTLIVALILLVAWVFIIKRGKKVNLDSYAQDFNAANEFNTRLVEYNPDKEVFNLLKSSLYEGYDLDTYKAYFPVYQDSASIFTAEKRAENLTIAKRMIANYDSIVQEASSIHRVPRILIYAIMISEHERSVSLKKAESYNRPGAPYVGLMQISSTTASDSLSRNITYKKLSKPQIALFKDKGIIKGEGKDAQVFVSKNDLRNVAINIHAGTEYLSRHISNYGIFQPIKIAVAYNQGEGRLKLDGLSRASDTEIMSYYTNTKNYAQYAQVKGYLLKMFGEHGACDILFNDLKIYD
jgi:soluble lytic murein transglycosylase-like protein